MSLMTGKPAAGTLPSETYVHKLILPYLRQGPGLREKNLQECVGTPLPSCYCSIITPVFVFLLSV
jgi:hypothetical protein